MSGELDINVDFRAHWQDLYSGDDSGSSSDSNPDEVLDFDLIVGDSESEPEPKEGPLLNFYATYSTECQPMIRLIEKHHRKANTGSLEELPRFLNSIRASDLEQGAQAIANEVTRRLSLFQYASLYKYSEGLRDSGTQMCKLDLLEQDNILIRAGFGERPLPSYFKTFFMLSCKHLLRFSDFMECVDIYIIPMTAHVKKDMKEHFNILSANRNFGCDEFQKCLDELNSLIVQFQKCREDLYKDFEFLYQAKLTLWHALIEITCVQDIPIGLEGTTKLCMLRDFCCYSVLLYANTVLKAIEAIKSYSNTKKKLQIA